MHPGNSNENIGPGPSGTQVFPPVGGQGAPIPPNQPHPQAPAPQHPQHPQQLQQQQQGQGFKIVMRGYDREEVHRALNEREQSLRQIANQRDAARGRAEDFAKRLESSQARIGELSSKVDRLAKAPIQASDLSERLDYMLKLATEEAAEIVNKAKADAAELTGVHQRKIDQLETERVQQEKAHTVLVDGVKKAAADAKAKADAERKQQDADSLAKRTAAETASATKITQQEIASADKIAKQEKASADKITLNENNSAAKIVANEKASADKIALNEKNSAAKVVAQEKASADKIVKDQAASATEATKRVKEATDEATKRIAEATAKVNQLRDLRNKIAEQLDASLTKIQASKGMLEPLTEEKTLPANPNTPTKPTPIDATTKLPITK